MTPTRTLTAHCTLSQDGLPLLTIDNEHARAEISLFGAHVLSYRRHGEPASLWLSDKAVLDGSKPIRGGIPLCCPWFGPSPARVGSGKPAHGFARNPVHQQPVGKGQPLAAVHQHPATLCTQICHCGINGERQHRQRIMG